MIVSAQKPKKGKIIARRTHLVGENPIEMLMVQRHEPVQPDVLVLPQCVLQQKRHLPQCERM